MTPSSRSRTLSPMGAAAANLRTKVQIERQRQENRSRVQVFTDHITALASSFPFIVVHIV